MTFSRVSIPLFGFVAVSLNCGFCATLPVSATPTPEATGSLTGQLAKGSAYDTLWSIPQLYKNDANPILEEFAIQGQLQAQCAYGSADNGEYGSGDRPNSSTWGDVEVRRFRLGLKGRMFRFIKFHSLIDLYPDLSPRIYKGIAETYLTFAPSDAFNLSLGKAELKFTREQEISSREILPFERSQLVNLFYGGELTGAWVSGKNLGGGWLYELGVFGNDRQDEWTEFNGGAMILTKVGYNYTARTHFDLAQAELQYLHNTQPGTVGSTGLASPSFSDCIALSNDLTQGHFSLATELFWGDGADKRPNVAGFTVMPAVFLSEKLQLVTTFQVAASSGDNGISLPTRYEGQIDLPTSEKSGDTFLAGYAGLNYYFYGHKLKVMTGVQFSHLSGGEEDFNGWTWLGGFRTSF